MAARSGVAISAGFRFLVAAAPPYRTQAAFSWREIFPALLAYLAFAALITWPMLLDPAAGLFADYGDARGVTWWLWWRNHGQPSGLMAAPFGLPASQVIAHPISDGMLLLLTRAWNEIAAMNLFALVAFCGTAASTYVVLRLIGVNRAGGFLAGLAFGFCPAAVMQVVGGHSPYAFNVFVPIFLLALFGNRRRRTAASALLLAMSFSAICMSALYFGYFALYVGLFFLGYDYLASDPEQRSRMARNYLLSAAFAFSILIPVELPAIIEQLTVSRDVLASAGHVRNFDELYVFSARALEYLTPSIDQRVVGRFFETFVRSNLHGSNVFEQTLYLGIVPIGLLAAGLVAVFRGGMVAEHRHLFLFFALAALWMFFLSLPPRIGGIPTVSLFAFDIAPMFRVYARFGILVCFFVACAAAVSVTHFERVLSRAEFRVFAALMVVGLGLEFWSAPPRPRAEQPPPVYRWLAGEPGDVIIAEYPMVRYDEAAFYTYPYWQRIHGKRMINGASPDNRPAWSLYERAQDLASPGALAALAQAGVKYVIVHRSMYPEGPIPAALKRYYPPERSQLAFDGGRAPTVPAGFKVHKEFGDDVVLTLIGRE